MATNGACELQGGVLDIGILRDDALNELIGILDDEAPSVDDNDNTEGMSQLVPQTCLVLDPLLQGALQLVVTEGPKMFKQHSVKDLVELSWFPLATACKTVIYLVRPNVESMKQVNRKKSTPKSIPLFLEFPPHNQKPHSNRPHTTRAEVYTLLGTQPFQPPPTPPIVTTTSSMFYL